MGKSISVCSGLSGLNCLISIKDRPLESIFLVSRFWINSNDFIIFISSSVNCSEGVFNFAKFAISSIVFLHSLFFFTGYENFQKRYENENLRLVVGKS